ncbi:carboxymuconolactone decarboxylase family protein [Roseibium denhamense]|uniref:carboxymuconolactone decarboxylase family protein n=1 Tax=Roseibium denhamense TaxID=76305 RepID=UPI0012BBD2E7|nr:carboxymuconolactone decarboxylase family protein [Roseibium denhamense]MTI06575.1 carboxymuconolactone decarboxylase family protein [Roseibium denhamense]
MTDFTIHTLESAPEGGAELLEKSQKAFGRIPGLHAVMSESPQLLDGYQRLHQLFQETSLTTVEQNVVWLVINVEHECHYCVPAHTGIAHMQKVPEDVIEALRNNTPLADPKLEALREFTLKVVRQRGYVSDEEVQTFLDAGFTKRNVLDIILGLAQKVMSNYVNHIAETPVDKVFHKFAWTPPARAAAE